MRVWRLVVQFWAAEGPRFVDPFLLCQGGRVVVTEDDVVLGGVAG